MALVMTSGPALEPVTVSEAKAHLRLDGTAEDALVTSLILTSRLHIEAALGLALITQSWMLSLDRWPPGIDVKLPLAPVLAIGEVRVRDAADVATIVPAGDYLLAEGTGLAPRLVRKSGAWPSPAKPASGIEILFTAGFGASASDVPAPLRHALLMLTAHWYEHRDPIEIGNPATAVPGAISELLIPYRRAKL